MEYSLEQLNYFRICDVSVNLVPVGLRQIFRNEWDVRYKTTLLGEWKDTPQNGGDFYHKERRKCSSKNARYLTKIQNGNTAEWDCTCLFFAILYSNSIGTTLSPAVQIHVDDLRQVRNDIAHISEAKLTDAEFQNYVARVLHAFTSLSLPINEIEDVKNQTSFPTKEVETLKKQVRDLKAELDQTKSDLDATKNTLQSTEADLLSSKEENKSLTQEINSKLQSFCFLSSQPPHEVIRRSSDTDRITCKMQELENGANGAVTTIYLSGNPGCGKSQLARQLGRECFSKRSGEAKGMLFVATLNAESVQTLADSYITLGRHLGLTEHTLTSLEATKQEKPGETIQQVQRLILPNVRKYSKWMIIADNIVDLTLVRSFLPHTGSEEWGHGQVLITTQDSSAAPHNAPHTYHESFSEGMQPDDAVELLEKVSQILDQEQAGNVAKALDYQPLALAAAAYYVQTVVKNGSPNYSWTEYMERLTLSQREATENLLAFESSAYSKTSATAVKMALQRAVETDKVLRQMFSFFALCADEVIPLEAVAKFVKARLTDQPEELIKAKILRSSLILVSAEKEVERVYLGLHNIVHVVLKQGAICKMEPLEENQNMAEAVKIFESLLELNRKNHRLLMKLTSHCKSLLKHMTLNFTSSESTFLNKLTTFITVDIVVDWLDLLGCACIGLSDISFAKYVVDLACSLLLGENISHTDEGAQSMKGKIFNTTGVVYGRIGEYSQAKEMHQKALVILKKIFGEEHANVATSYNNLAGVYCSIGEYSQAKEMHQKALVILKKIFGEEHANVATSYNNLAGVYCSIGEYSQAKEMYQKALVILKKIFGEEHANVATSYNNLAGVYCSIGEYSQAKEMHQKALVIRKKIFGEEHANVATSYNNLAGVYCSIGEYSQAKEMHQKALVILKKIFGEEHANVATSYNNLAGVYCSIGEYSQAKEMYQKALVILKKIFGEEHANVATSYNNLAGVYCSIGEYSQAKEMHQKALVIRKKIFGEEHANVATSYNNLAGAYCSIGEYSQAKEMHQKALVIQKKIFGEEHAHVATSYNNLAVVYNSIGEYSQAKEMHQKALVIWKKIFGEEHAHVATSYNNLAGVYCSIGEYSQAKEMHQKALVILKKIFGEEHANVATSYNNLAGVYCSIGEYSQAKEMHQKALVIQKKIFGEEHADVATSCNNLAVVYNSIGEYSQAKEMHQKALVIRKKIFGEEHANVATSYNNLAVVYDSIGEYSQAKEMHQKALVIRKKIFGEEHANVATSYNNLAGVYCSIGEYSQAKEMHQKALVIRKKIFGEEHANVATSYNNLAGVYCSIGEYSQAKEMHQKALVIRKKIFGEEHANVATS